MVVQVEPEAQPLQTLSDVGVGLPFIELRKRYAL
jgi:hypothetical protein